MKNEWVETIRQWIRAGKLADAERWLKSEIGRDGADDALYFWMGNLRRKQCNWQDALQYYAEALALNPESPAREAREMITDILRFYDKERYNF